MALAKKLARKLKGTGSAAVRATPRTGGVKPGKATPRKSAPVRTPRKKATPMKRALTKVATKVAKKTPKKAAPVRKLTPTKATKGRTGGLKGMIGKAAGGAVKKAMTGRSTRHGGSGSALLPKNRKKPLGRYRSGGGEGGKN